MTSGYTAKTKETQRNIKLYSVGTTAGDTGIVNLKLLLIDTQILKSK